VQDLVPQLDQLRAEEVGREHPGGQHDQHRQDRAETGDVDADPVFGLKGRRQEEQ
jgi:hypothetical protein